jgi:2-hydroxy-3-oxopropionate reductase
MADKPSIGFIGLGIMGAPMASNLIRAGYLVTVHNRTREKEAPLVAEGARAVGSAADVARISDVVITMLPDSPDVEAVYFGEGGIFEAARSGHLFIDMSTVSPTVSRRINENALRHGADSLDAPVSGGDVGAREGTLSIMVGGNVAAFERAKPVLEVLGKNIVRIGEPGAGQVTKACNQIVVALTIEAVAEALVLAKKSGVDPAAVRQALLGGFAQSRVLEVHGQRALEGRFDPGFRVRLHRKDLSIALDVAKQVEASVPTTALVHDMMNSLLAEGLGDKDHSIIIEEVARRARTDLAERH